MANYLYAFNLNTAEQPDLFYSEDGKLKLDTVYEELEKRLAPVDEEGFFDGEGFGKLEMVRLGDTEAISAFCVTSSSLGYYNEAKIRDNHFTTEKRQHKYYTKSTIFLTDNSEFIVMFDNSMEERAKSGVKKQIELLGFEMQTFYIEDPLIRNIQTQGFPWHAATFNKIVKHGDSTKRVSFAIDPANNEDPSLVQQQYSDHGEMSHIKFDLPFNPEEAPHSVTVTLYSDKNRIIINEDEFPNTQKFYDFVVYLLNKLRELQ
ncbi:hypothetical protein [Priestia aryabhattai]|uniref:hypothetical protein n=1 Tax=Priestia aryabhattai TaxID=412384 RepID=UPI00064EA156|nr:hypothetical protein [Priestia aryabhattai]KML27768.1 hypothetical protein VL11_17500 [Priestia aryabhattai]KMO01923.1 hypothetical protein ABV89_00115 [Priestia aryabhattai]